MLVSQFPLASISTANGTRSPSDRVLDTDSAGTLISFPQSEIFEISTRHLPKNFCAINQDSPGFEVNRWTGCGWTRSDIDTALGIDSHHEASAADIRIDDKATILYVHGNFMERNNTLERVRILDAQLKKRAKQDYRLIVLSWPSQKTARPIRSVYENAESS